MDSKTYNGLRYFSAAAATALLLVSVPALAQSGYSTGNDVDRLPGASTSDLPGGGVGSAGGIPVTRPAGGGYGTPSGSPGGINATGTGPLNAGNGPPESSTGTAINPSMMGTLNPSAALSEPNNGVPRTRLSKNYPKAPSAPDLPRDSTAP